MSRKWGLGNRIDLQLDQCHPSELIHSEAVGIDLLEERGHEHHPQVTAGFQVAEIVLPDEDLALHRDENDPYRAIIGAQEQDHLLMQEVHPEDFHQDAMTTGELGHHRGEMTGWFLLELGQYKIVSNNLEIEEDQDQDRPTTGTVPQYELDHLYQEDRLLPDLGGHIVHVLVVQTAGMTALPTVPVCQVGDDDHHRH